jgi:hypothetical protein
MAALAVEVHHDGPASVHDLNAMLISSGLDALPVNGQAIDSTVEKDDLPEEKVETGYTRDSAT